MQRCKRIDVRNTECMKSKSLVGNVDTVVETRLSALETASSRLLPLVILLKLVTWEAC